MHAAVRLMLTLWFSTHTSNVQQFGLNVVCIARIGRSHPTQAKTANAWDTRLTDFTKKDKKYDLVAQSIKTTAQVSAAAAAMVAAGGTAAVKVVSEEIPPTAKPSTANSNEK